MLTPQEVSSRAFAKAMMGGYNMAAVDEFLDVLTDDYTNLYKENAALKSKLKVLVEKVEEYRATEDSMRATLLTAQKMADSIVKEAETKRDEMLAAAEIQCKRMQADAESGTKAKMARYEQDLSAAEARLQKGQQDLNRFITEVRDLCLKELAFSALIEPLGFILSACLCRSKDSARMLFHANMERMSGEKVGICNLVLAVGRS